MMRKICTLLFTLALVSMANAAIVKVFDESVKPVPGLDTLWLLAANDNVLMEAVYAESSCVVIIEKGAVIRGLSSFGANAASLIICRGAKIHANGTADEPIIFTAMEDNIDNPSDFGPAARGLWGGLVICGYGIADIGTGHVEGLDPTDPRTEYGGSDNADNSGSLKYISLRHGGSAIETNKEVNGLSLYAVGSGTTIEHVEILANDDDGIEFFGGAVNIKYASVAFGNDDGFDFDQGFVGKGQYWFAIHNNLGDFSGHPDRGAEMDGVKASGNTPFTNPTISNATLIGPGANASHPAGALEHAMRFRESCAGKWYNSIVTDWPGIAVRMDANGASFPVNSEQRLYDGTLQMKNCLFWNIGAGGTFSAITSNSYVADSLSAYCWIEDPQIRGISYTAANPYLDPRPAAGSPATTKPVYSSLDSWFDTPQFIGAFGPQAEDYWLDGWTGLQQTGVATRLLTISPRKAELASDGATKMDVQFLIKWPGFNPGAGHLKSWKILIDGGFDVSSAFATRQNSTTLVDGGWVFKVKDVQVSELAGFPVNPGWHSLSGEFDIQVGTHRDTIADTVSFYVQQ